MIQPLRENRAFRLACPGPQSAVYCHCCEPGVVRVHVCGGGRGIATRECAARVLAIKYACCEVLVRYPYFKGISFGFLLAEGFHPEYILNALLLGRRLLQELEPFDLSILSCCAV